ADGELVAQTAQRLGCSVVRGSATRGGVKALRQVIRLGEGTHVVATPDGPRGPRRHFHEGVIYMAARTGMLIVPCGFASRRPWRANSWDCFALPKPFSRARCVIGKPIHVPAEFNRDQLEAFRQQAEDAMSHVTELAEAWVETGIWPELPLASIGEMRRAG